MKTIYIENEVSNLVEVTIEFSNDEKFWTSFTTPEYLKEQLTSENYISSQKLIILNELTESRIKTVISELDQHDKLIESCNKY